MKKLIFYMVIPLLFSTPLTLFAEESVEEQIHREKAIAIHEINEKYEPSGRVALTFASTTSFPSGHPVTAVSDTWAWFSDSFNIYIWRESGAVWIEVEPLSTTVFICSPCFTIIQNETQFDTVKLEKGGDDCYCGDLYVPAVFKLSQWSIYTNANLNQSFTLIFDGGTQIYSLDIPSASSTPPPSGSGNLVTSDLWIKAVIHTEEKGPIEAVWQKGGEDTTSRGDRVIWGHFYASPSDVTWGSQNNPDLFVKIWFDVSGRVDVNYFHVSVPEIEVYSDYPYNGTVDEQGTTTMDNRYIRHEYMR